MRLDNFLVEKEYFKTRNKAQQAIKSKRVKVNNIDLEEAYLPYKDIEQITNEYNIAVEEINNQEFGLAILNIYDSFIGSINNYLENELSLLKDQVNYSLKALKNMVRFPLHH